MEHDRGRTRLRLMVLPNSKETSEALSICPDAKGRTGLVDVEAQSAS